MTDILSIRPMVLNDVPEVVSIHIKSFEGFFLSFLGPRFLREYYRGIVDLGQIAIVLEGTGGDSLQGFVTGIDNDMGFYRRLLRKRAFRFGVAAVPAMLRDPRRVVPRVLRAFLKRPGGGEKYGTRATTLTSLAVLPDCQARGAGKALVAAYIDEARHRGFVRIYLETDADNNDRVCAFYDRRGFSICRTYSTAEGRRMHEYLLDL